MRTVSIVVPTYNNVLLLRECLLSLRELDYPRAALEIVVVDNGSSGGGLDRLRTSFPEVAFVRLEHNTGFAVACNRGAATASREYVAFLNDDAVVEKDWIEGLFAGLDEGGAGAVCAASHIRSRDGQEIEYSGASANLFGVGRPRSVWGWPDSPEPPGEGSPVLFASGGAVLIHRRTFLDAGGFDPQFFAYFEDVDLGWRLWLLGHRVVYAPRAVARHMGGATGSRSPAHRRYTLWECNSLATIVKNYESGKMERILSAAVMLLYKRALLAAGDAHRPSEYQLSAPRDTNTANVERFPRLAVAHLAAINRFNSLLPYFMQERKRIQAARVRTDSEILPLFGRLWEPQFAGAEYARAARQLALTLGLVDLAQPSVPQRLLIIASAGEQDQAYGLAEELTAQGQVAVVLLSVDDLPRAQRQGNEYLVHSIPANDPALSGLVQQADVIRVFPGALAEHALRDATAPVIRLEAAST